MRIRQVFLNPARGKDLGDWRAACVQAVGEGDEVRDELSCQGVVCSTYERLLQRCMTKFEEWVSGRQEICEVGSGSEEGGAELLRLKAAYGKSYSDLCRHVGGCECCKLFSGTDHRDGRQTANCCI